MTTFWNILSVLVLYPIIGTLMFAFMEKSAMPKKWKILLLTFGNPVLACLAIRFVLSSFHQDPETATSVMNGALLWNVFSGKKYFIKLDKTENEIFIDYISPFLRNRTIKIPVSKFKASTLSAGHRIIDKPSIFKVDVDDETLKFYVLDDVKESLPGYLP